MNEMDGGDKSFLLGFKLLAAALLVGILALSSQGLFATSAPAPAAAPNRTASTTVGIGGGHFSLQFILHPDRRPGRPAVF